MDPYRDSAAPPPVKKIIVKTWKVSFSAFMFAICVAGCVASVGAALRYSYHRATTPETPEPCVEMVKIIEADNDDRHCSNGGHFTTERMGDNTHVLLHCVCDASDAGAAR